MAVGWGWTGGSDGFPVTGWQAAALTAAARWWLRKADETAGPAGMGSSKCRRKQKLKKQEAEAEEASSSSNNETAKKGREKGGGNDGDGQQ